jgi:hypothetical protein
MQVNLTDLCDLIGGNGPERKRGTWNSYFDEAKHWDLEELIETLDTYFPNWSASNVATKKFQAYERQGTKFFNIACDIFATLCEEMENEHWDRVADPCERGLK